MTDWVGTLMGVTLAMMAGGLGIAMLVGTIVGVIVFVRWLKGK